MDYASLRQEGIRLLERMTGGQWTDFNDHDPGITLLEQLCYALTDLGYRIGYEIPDLLADGGSDPYASLHPPEAILPCQPVTPADFRRLVIDVKGVRNAWIEPSAAGPLGLQRVLLDTAEGVEAAVVEARVARRLHASRALCEDFAVITALEKQLIQVEATIEIAPVDDPGALLDEICRKLADEISPAVPFSTLGERLDAGAALDEIFEGPRLDHGFITDAALENATLRTRIYTSDLMHLIMDVAGVRAVSRIRLAHGGEWADWFLTVDADKIPILDVSRSILTLRRAGKAIAAPEPAPLDRGETRKTRSGATVAPAGRDRHVARYTSVQQHLPPLYGIGESGLPDSATPLRKAQAKQLRAYLMLFDQLLANSFAQLAHVKDLFSFSGDGDGAQTYFAQALDQPGLGLEEIRVLDEQHRIDLQDMVESRDPPTAPERRNRFLNHLLARYAEPIGDHALAAEPEERARRKQRLLFDYPRSSSARGTGHDGFAGVGARSGVAERLRLALGLVEEDGEALVAVEHILLRPLDEDLRLAPDAELPPPAAPPPADPYSLQVTFVLPTVGERLPQPEFQTLVEHTLRAETPAHLSPYVRWMDPAAWAKFSEVHVEWLRRRQETMAHDFPAPPDEPGAGPAAKPKIRSLDLRAARDQLVDILEIAETYPLPDTEVHVESMTVDFDSPITIYIDPSQVNVRYELYEGDQRVEPVCFLLGTGSRADFQGPRIRDDHTFRVLAFKIDRPALRVFLLQTVTVKIGLNRALPVSTTTPVIDHGGATWVTIGSSQPSVSYRLIGPDGSQLSTAVVEGNGAEIALQTRALLEDTEVRVRATREFTPAEDRANLDVVLLATLPIAVRAAPGLDLSFDSLDGTPICDPQGEAAIRIAGSQESVVYSAYVRPLSDADFLYDPPPDVATLTVQVPGAPDVQVPAPERPAAWQVQPGFVQRATDRGNGGALVLSLGMLAEDSVLVVQAHKDHTPTLLSDVQLVQALAILVRPGPVTLALRLYPRTDGSGGLLVSGGQPGVYYHFRREGEAGEIGLPAYFHQVDKGVDRLRIETDLVIARDPPSAQETDPLVEVAVLPLGTTVSVMAVRARSGVAWSAPKSVAVTVMPTTP